MLEISRLKFIIGAQNIERFVNKKIKRNREKKKLNNANFCFTINDLKDILDKTLKEREDILAKQYDEELDQRLQGLYFNINYYDTISIINYYFIFESEQFSSFSRYSDDFFHSPKFVLFFLNKSFLTNLQIAVVWN